VQAVGIVCGRAGLVLALTAVLLAGGCGSVGGGKRSVPARPSTVRLAGLPAWPPEFVDGAFAGRDAGWLVAATGFAGTVRAQLWHTADAGASWQVQWQGPGSVVSISASDAAHAWALIRCPVSGREHGCRGGLIATVDAGRTWQRVAALLPSANHVQFLSSSFGVATADEDCPSVFRPSRCPGEVLVSEDGGIAWRRVLSSPNPVFATASVTGQLWAAEVLPGPGTETGARTAAVRFMTSSDGGTKWRTLSELGGLGSLSADTQVQLSAGPNGLEWASVFDQQSCAMHGCGTAQLYQSLDGGRHWKLADLYRELNVGCGPDGIVFSAAADGTVWAASGQPGATCAPPFGMLYRHGPSGWRQLRPWQLAGVSSLIAVSRNVAYAISAQNAVVRTDDGGRRWTQLLPALAPTGQLEAVSASTALGAQDATDAGAVLRTTDGGRTWRQIADLPGVITQLDSPTARAGIAVTLQTNAIGRPLWRLWQTRDGGLSWRSRGPLLSQLSSWNSGVYGPWISADGHGVLLTVTGSLAWTEPASGGSAPARIWTTDDWGARWSRGRLLPLGSGIRSYIGSVSILVTRPGRWTGWMIGFTGRTDRIEQIANTGSTLRPLPGSPAVQRMQLVTIGTGYAWGFQAQTSHKTLIVSLYSTHDGGLGWQHTQIATPAPPLSSNPNPITLFVDFTNANDGWLLIGSTGWHTTDAGRTWQAP
jgi:photosystem II stability/assembly factor-like uncharacterized protein